MKDKDLIQKMKSDFAAASKSKPIKISKKSVDKFSSTLGEDGLTGKIDSVEETDESSSKERT